MVETIYVIFKVQFDFALVQFDFALEVWFSICCHNTVGNNLMSHFVG